MEEEISLVEIFITLWKGKYIIISITVLAMLLAALISIFIIVPVNSATAIIDLTNNPIYAFSSANKPIDIDTFILKFENSNYMASALEHLNDDDKAFTGNLSVKKIRGNLIGITFDNRYPQLARDGANATAISFIQSIYDEHMFIITSEVEELEKTITYYQERISELYGEIDDSQISFGEELQLDPRYDVLRTQQGIYTAHLFDLLIEQENMIRKYEESFDYFVKQGIIIPASLPNKPVNRGWPLNTAVAGVLGLMLSVFIVFMRPAFAEISKEISESKKGNNA